MPYGILDGIKKIPHAGMYVKDNASTTAIAEAGTYYQFLFFDTNGPSYKLTPDHTNDHITIDQNGTYCIHFSATLASAVAGAVDADMLLHKNNGATPINQVHFERRLSGGGTDTGSCSASGVVTLSANDTIEVWITNNTNTNALLLSDCSLNIIRLA